MNKTIYMLLFALMCSAGVQAQYLNVLIGNGYELPGGYTGDGGPATAATTSGYDGVAIDKHNNFYMFDGKGTSIYIRVVDGASSIVTTIAGGGLSTATADSIPATAAYIGSNPWGMCTDTTGDLLYTEGSRVRRLNRKTGIVTTIAGSLTKGHGGDGGPATAAGLYDCFDVAADVSNNIYIVDYGSYNVRRVDAVTGIISTVTGEYHTSAYSGDGGPATAGRLFQPTGIIADDTGNLYIADKDGHVRFISARTGIISTFAGCGSTGPLGDGGPATAALLHNPDRIAIDKAGDIYISERTGYRVRKVDHKTGIITTYAGIGSSSGGAPDYADKGLPATSGRMWPAGIRFNSCGNMYVHSEGLVWKVTPTVDDAPCSLTLGPDPSLAVATVVPDGGIRLYPNPAMDGTVTLQLPEAGARVTITNAMGQLVQELYVAGTAAAIETGWPPGLYVVTATTSHQRLSAKLVVQ